MKRKIKANSSRMWNIFTATSVVLMACHVIAQSCNQYPSNFTDRPEGACSTDDGDGGTDPVGGCIYYEDSGGTRMCAYTADQATCIDDPATIPNTPVTVACGVHHGYCINGTCNYSTIVTGSDTVDFQQTVKTQGPCSYGND